VKKNLVVHFIDFETVIFVAFMLKRTRHAYLLFLPLFLFFCLAQGGHEILYKHELSPVDIQPHELAIIQYDSRPLDEYWNTSVRWNKMYSDLHGHQYLFVSSKGNCRFSVHLLADPWCKVKAMMKVNSLEIERFKLVKAFLFLDSDALVTVKYPMTTVLSYIQQKLQWNTTLSPVAFNQDGPGWSCKHTLQLGYNLCLNSGTVFWMKGDAAHTILQDWWMSSGEPYKQTNKFPSAWRLKVRCRLLLSSDWLWVFIIFYLNTFFFFLCCCV
jgi:hypothetical protein